MEEFRCPECGKAIAEDAPNCPHCGHEIEPEPQRRGEEQASMQQRVYIYGRRKRGMSRETRAVLTVILIAVTILAVCRITHGDDITSQTCSLAAGSVVVCKGGSIMATYEYRLLQLPEGGSVSRANDQIQRLADDGWEAVLMSGTGQLNILFRRQAQVAEEAAAAQAVAEAPV